MGDSMNSNMPSMDMPAALAPSEAMNSSTNSSMSAGTDCKITMLWNWHTIDACFLAESWHIHSASAFAGLCIGVVLMVMLLEALRRVAKFYDQYLVRLHRHQAISAAVHSAGRRSVSSTRDTPSSASMTSASARRLLAEKAHIVSPTANFRPNFIQQGVRALLHTAQFAVAYWIMLLAMYYNGYIIICIFAGAFLGAYAFRWERIGGYDLDSLGDEATEATGCCG